MRESIEENSQSLAAKHMKWNLTMDEGMTFDAGSSMAARAIRRDGLQAFFDRGDFNFVSFPRWRESCDGQTRKDSEFPPSRE